MHEHRPGTVDTPRRANARGAAITWLHLSDLHHGQPGEASLWPQRLEAALGDMRAWANVRGQPDLILFTGDLAYSGKESEYAQVDETLARIRETVGGDPLVVPVPGNHDLSRPSATSATARGMKEYLTDSDLRRSVWEKPDSDNENLAFLRQRFAAYHDWWQRRIARDWHRRGLFFEEGHLPGDFRLSFEKDGFRLGLLGLNSAFLHLYGGCKGKLAVEPAQVPGFVEWARTCHAALLLMHHPFDWLHEEWQKRFRREIYASTRFVACLFGHMHEPVDTRESRNKQVRHWLQAASLCGLENYEDPAPGTRSCGYAWGRIERVDGEHGRLTLWRRELAETHGGDLRFDRPRGEDAEESFQITIREVELERTRATVVALPQHRTMVLERFAEDMANAAELFGQGRFTAAAEAYRRVRDRIEAHGLVEQDNELRRVLAQARLYVSASLLSLQDRAGAGEQAQEIDVADLEDAERVVLAQVWVQLREFERARAAIDNLDAVTAAPVQQLLAIEEACSGLEPGCPVTATDLDRVLASMDEERKNIVRRVLDGDADAIPDFTARIRASALLVVCGRHDIAARWALELVERSHGKPGVQAAAIRSLLSALEWSAHDMPVSCQHVAKELRPRVMRLLEEYLDPLKESPLSAAIPVPELAELMAEYQSLVRDRVRLEKACERMREHGRETRHFEPDALVTHDALEQIPGLVRAPGHPWHERLRAAARLAQENEYESARALATQLSEEFPGYMAIEWLAALLWVDNGDLRRARTHAQRAFDAIPGAGQATLLGELLVYTNEHQAVWTNLREQLAYSPDITARRVLATAAFRAAAAQAPDCWRDVVAHEHATARDFMGLARSLYVTGEMREAVEAAWKAFEHASSDSLTTAELGHCAVMQLERPTGPETERLLALARRFLERTRARADAEAGHWYVNMWHQLGRPPELPGPNEVAELESLGVVQRQPRTQAMALHIEEAWRWQVALAAYYRGDISFSSVSRRLCKLEVEVFSVFLDNDVPWTTPLVMASDDIDLAGKELLLGLPEILLLDHFGLLDALEQSLGADGRILLFDDVVERQILGSPAWFRIHEREDERHRLTALRERLDREPRVLREARRTDEPEDEAAWCTQRGFTLVSALEGRGAFPLNALVDGLIARGFLPPERARQDQAASAWAHAGSPWPERIALDASALHIAEQKGILAAVIDAFPNRMSITPHARESMERTIWTLETRRRGGERARRVLDWWTRLHGRERIKVIPQPEIDLPPGRDGFDASEEIQCIREAAIWRRALVDAPARRLLRADFVSAQLFDEVVPARLLQPLAWTSERYAAMVAESRAVTAQVISFTALARSLAGQRDIADGLLGLGFVDAYRDEELLDMALRFHAGLAAPMPVRRLDAIEVRAHDEKRNGYQHARRHLGALYATTIWTAWYEGDHPQREGVTATLLDRAAGIGRDGDALGSLVYFLTGLTCYQPEASLDGEADGDASHVRASSAGHMWSCINQWLAKYPVWRPVCQHAFTDFLVTHDDVLSQSDGPIVALVVAAEALHVESADGSLIPAGSVLEAIAILSAQWAVRPLSWISVQSPDDPDERETSIEEVLARVVESAREGNRIYPHGEAWLFQIMTHGKPEYVWLPPEAVFLRVAGSDLWPALAAQLVRWRGPDDGCIVMPLVTLIEHPEDERARRVFAHLAVSAGWRRFPADPRSLRFWTSQRARFILHAHAPSSISELRTLLSEPGPLPEAPELASVMIDRVIRGPWQNRHDRQALVEIASETILGLVPLYIMVRQSVAESEQLASELGRAMERLLHAQEQPAIRVAADISLCAYLAPQSSEETRAQIVERIVQVLQSAAAEPLQESVAAFEPALLRIAAFTVWRLGGAAETARDRLWLTWRLHQWMIRQIERLPAERRAPSIELLFSAYPDLDALIEVAENDMLDPVRFGHGRLDHRLISILHTLAMIRPVFLQVLWSPALENLLEELSTRSPTNEEAWAAALPPPYSCLGWGDVPRTVPELARKVLDALHADLEDAVAASLSSSSQESDRE